jgi:probable F420-dependent oxidoreductase
MGWLLASTRRLRVGASVLVVPYRNPVVTAKQLAVLDVLSGGRVFVGCGTGWWPEEFEALHAPPFAARGAVTDEYIRVMVELWTKDAPAFEGKYYRIRDVTMLPRPVQTPHPPIWIGGHTAPAIRRAGELGDAWHPIGLRPPAGLTPGQLGEKRRELHALCEQHGRDPNQVRIAFRCPLAFSDRERKPMQGTPAQILEDIAAYGAQGVGHFTFDLLATEPGPLLESVERIGSEILPKAR